MTDDPERLPRAETRERAPDAEATLAAAEADASPEARLPARLRLLSALGSLAALVLLVLGWRWLDLYPPEEISMAAGRPGSGYHQIAERYRAILAEDGIRLRILETAGSIENADRLAAGEADVALLQGGVPVEPLPGGDMPETIASLLLEPVFVFARDPQTLSPAPTDWEGLRLAVGPEGSGTRFALGRIGEAMGMDPERTRRVPLGGLEAAEALLAGEVDVAVFVSPVDAPYLSRLFEAPDVGLVSLENRDGLVRRLPELVAVDLPAGTIDYARRVPPRRIALLAAAARMVARDDLHPAAVNRLVRAAQLLHGGPGILSAEGRFPVQRPVDRPLSTQAGALLKNEPQVLDTLLPYWISAQINRLLILLVPLFFLLLPLVRAVPGFYDWIVRLSIHRHDRALREIDIAAARTDDAEALAQLAGRLDGVEDSLRRMQVPVRFREVLFVCRNHVDLIRSRIEERRHAAERGEHPRAQASGAGTGRAEPAPPAE